MKLKQYILQLAADKIEAVDTYVRKANVKNKEGIEKERPDNNRSLYWAIYRTDAIVGACIDFTISFVIGAGMNVTVVDRDGEEVNIPEFNSIIRKSKPRSVMNQFLKDGHVSGDGFLYKLTSDDGDMITRFEVIPSNQMRVHRDEKGYVDKYVQELGESEAKYPTFEPTEVVHYRNRGIAGEAYGRSDVEPITEVSEILRDMIIDLSNFISTKAYAPVLWKFGSADRPWNPKDIGDFMRDRTDVEPGDQIGVQGDIEVEAIGVGDKALDIEPYLTFFASMIVSGLRVPATLTSVIGGIGQFTADAQSNAYARRINDIRSELGELLEVELFDDIIRQNGYGSDLRSKVTWKKHDDESLRLAVNNLIQLVQNSIISPQKARMDLSYPMDVTGELNKAIDRAEAAEPAIPSDADSNTMKDTGDDDGRADEKRKEFTEQ